MRAALLVVALPLAGCDILFELRDVKRVDAGPPAEASIDAPNRCPLSDTFDNNTIDPIWSVVDTTHEGAVVSEKMGALDIALKGNVVGYNGVNTATTHALTGMVVRATLYPMNEVGYCEAIMQLATDPLHALRISTGAGSITFAISVNGVVMSKTKPYDEATQRHWRFRHDAVASLMHFEVSGNGIEFATELTTPVPFSLDAAFVSFVAGTYQVGLDTPGAARFDDFTVCPP